LQEQQQVDIELLNHYVMSHTDSPMRGRLVASRVAADRRFGLGNCVLKIHPLAAESEQRRLGTVTELKQVLATTFGVDVPSGADIDSALERVVGAHGRGVQTGLRSRCEKYRVWPASKRL
jgi:N-hydroxyarylamine O-acetyltransferase